METKGEAAHGMSCGPVLRLSAERAAGQGRGALSSSRQCGQVPSPGGDGLHPKKPFKVLRMLA